MTDDTIEVLDDGSADESDLYLERLAEALLRLGIVEMEGVVIDGSEVAGAIMALDGQLTAGWQLAESVRWAQKTEARLEAIDSSADSEAVEAASRNKQYANEAMMLALTGWDEAAGLSGTEADQPAPIS